MIKRLKLVEKQLLLIVRTKLNTLKTVCVCVCVCARAHVCMRACACVYVCVCVRSRALVCVHACLRAYVCMCACVCVCGECRDFYVKSKCCTQLPLGNRTLYTKTFRFITNIARRGLTFTVQCKTHKISVVSKPAAVLIARDLGDQTVL